MSASSSGRRSRGGTGALDPIGIAAVLLSPIAWSLGSLFASHRASLPPDPLVNTGGQMVTGGLVLMAMAAVTGEFGRFDPAGVTTESIAAFFYLAVVGSLVAFTAYGWLLRVAPLPLVATYAYVNPVVAVILGAIVLQDYWAAHTYMAEVCGAATGAACTSTSKTTCTTKTIGVNGRISARSGSANLDIRSFSINYSSTP